jgi:hypothetical protein
MKMRTAALAGPNKALHATAQESAAHERKR